MKLANPLRSPLSIAVAGAALIAGVRLARIPIAIMLPVSAAMATAGATLRRSQEPKSFSLDNPALEAELLMVHRQAEVLAEGAMALRQQVKQGLGGAALADVVTAIQFTCDRAIELPDKLDRLAQHMQIQTSRVSIADMQAQLAAVEAQQQTIADNGVQTALEKISESLRRALQLVQEGQDARQVQVASLSGLILDFLGLLQEVQIKLRATTQTEAAMLELRSLSEQLGMFQENVDRLMPS